MSRFVYLMIAVGAVAGVMISAGRFLPMDVAQGSVIYRPVVVADHGAVPRETQGPTDAGARHEAADDPPFEAHEVLVLNAPSDFRTLAGTMGFRVVESRTLRNLDMRVFRVRLPEGPAVPAAVTRLRARFPQAIVDANHRYATAAGGPMPSSFARAAIGWTGLPADCGRGARIGMIDAGVDTRHPALAGAHVTYRAFNRPGRRPGPAQHGTAVGALLVGRPVAGRGWGGLVPGASLSAANIFEVTEAGRAVATASGLLAAADWIASRRVSVLNLSIAGPDNQVVRHAVVTLAKLGLVMVAAAGNNGSKAPPAYPAAYPEVIAVTAVAADHNVYGRANQGDYVEFAAPGVRLWTAVPDGGKYQSGTSFASPFVAAHVSVDVAHGGRFDVDTIRDRLRRATQDLGRPGRDTVYGWGLVKTSPQCSGS